MDWGSSNAALTIYSIAAWSLVSTRLLQLMLLCVDAIRGNGSSSSVHIPFSYVIMYSLLCLADVNRGWAR